MENLAEIAQGNNVVITEIKGDNRFITRVTSIGLIIGSKVEVLRNQKKAPMLIYGRDTMIALNRDECRKIMVKEA